MQIPFATNNDTFRLLAAILLAVAAAVVVVTQPLSAFAIAALLLVGAAVLYLKRPELFIYSMLFLAPFHFLVTETLLDTPSIGANLSLGGLYQDIWPLGLVGIWLIYGIVSGKLSVQRPPALLPLVLLGCWAVLHIVSIAPLTAALFGLRNLLRFAVLPFIVPIFLTTNVQIRRLFLAGMLGMALASMVSLIEAPRFITALLSGGSLNLATLPSHFRFVGIFGSVRQTETVVSNTFGIALALMATYSIGQALNARLLSRKSFYLLCSAALIVVNLLTFSRRGYFTLLFGPVLLLWWWKRSTATRVRMFLLLGILFALGLAVLEIVPVGDLIIGRSTLRVLDNPSFAGRQEDWRIIWDDVTDDPFRFLWGYGMASTGPAGVRFDVPNAVAGHNYYLMLWHQLGLVGVILFLALLWSTLRYGFRVANRLDAGELRLDVWFSLVVVVALALNGLLGTTFEAYPNDLIFWTAISLLTAAQKVVQRESLEQEKQSALSTRDTQWIVPSQQ